ncbi:MAG: TetR/AcrR family transcriptional regulator [Kangiellaceae bacterium]|nr:TetR/AcrR family transcriptional regulator [Kangiellaceae bacterium]
MSAGRKREFEVNEALRNAMFTFWEKGYTGTSLTDLTISMGINKPSLYSAFGNKEKLFVSATGYYTQNFSLQNIAKLRADDLSVNQRLSNFLLAVIETQCDPKLPSGCFVSLCASEAAGECMPKNAVKAIREIQSDTERFLKEFFEKEKEQGNLKSTININLAVLLTTTFIHGTASMARSNKAFSEISEMIRPAVESIISL